MQHVTLKCAYLQHLHTLPIAVARHRALPQVKAVPIVLPSGKQVFAGPICAVEYGRVPQPTSERFWSWYLITLCNYRTLALWRRHMCPSLRLQILRAHGVVQL